MKIIFLFITFIITLLVINNGGSSKNNSGNSDEINKCSKNNSCNAKLLKEENDFFLQPIYF